MEYIDKFPKYSQVIDIGGDRYFLGDQKPIDIGFKSRIDFIRGFDEKPRTELLMRKYFPFDRTDEIITDVDNDTDRKDLLAILEHRLNTIKNSQQFTSSILKNTIVQRYYVQLQKIINGIKYGAVSDNSAPMAEQNDKNIKEVESLSEDQIFQLILEISWYLMHPREVPQSSRKQFVNIVKEMNSLRLGDIVKQIRAEGAISGLDAEEKSLNFFKRINIGKVVQSKDKQSALDLAKEMAIDMKEEHIRKTLEERLRSILTILQAHKYIDDDSIAVFMKNLNSNAYKSKIQDISNSMAVKIGTSMEPFFQYYRVLYNPIYDFINDFVESNIKENSNKGSLVPIAGLLKLLHISENINSESAPSKFGIYRVKGLGADTKDFISGMIMKTEEHIATLEEEDALDFGNLIDTLPKIRLSSLINQFNPHYKNPRDILYIRYFTKKNIVVPTNQELEDSENGVIPKSIKSHKVSASSPQIAMDIQAISRSLKEFFTDDIFIICTKADQIIENIPAKCYDIDAAAIDITKAGIEVKAIDNYMTRMEIDGKPLYLDDAVNINTDTGINGPEIALATMIGFKHLLPK
jgi:hypothetical protein